MAQARQADRGIPQATILIFAGAMVLATVLTAVLLSGTIHFSPMRPAVTTDQVLLEAGREWEAQQRAQTGFGAVSDGLRNAGQQWEAERRAQSGQ